MVGNLGQTGVVDQVFHDVEVNGAASPYAHYIHVSSATGPTISAPGQISPASASTTCTMSSRRRATWVPRRAGGFDTRLEYTWKLETGGKIRVQAPGLTTINYDIQIAPTAPYTPTAGLVTGLNGSIPRWRVYNTIGWEKDGWTVNLGQTYYSSTIDTTWDPTWEPDYHREIPAYITYDASVGW